MTSHTSTLASNAFKRTIDDNLSASSLMLKPTPSETEFQKVALQSDKLINPENCHLNVDNTTSSNGKLHPENPYFDSHLYKLCNEADEYTSSNEKTEPRQLLSKLKLLKNLLVICLSVLLMFTAYEALMNLQSTINATKSIGTYTLAVVYGSFCISCLILPSLVIDKLSCKWTLVCSLLAYVPYIAANFYPIWTLFIPTAVLCGIAAGPLWAARCSYINELSFQYASYVKDSPSVITSLFFGVGSMFYQSSQILGNFISYLVLKPANISYEEVIPVLEGCGASFCNSEELGNASTVDLNINLIPPTDNQRYILIGIFLICSVASSVTIWLFLDELKSMKSSRNASIKTTTLKLLFAALKQLKKKEQLLILPLTFHLGLSDGFLFSDFTKAYIGCAWRIYHVGYVMMAYGTISCIFSVISAFFVKYFGRISVFLTSGIINAIKYSFLLAWNPNPNYPLAFFLIAGAWGCSDAIWWGQLNAFYGLLFKEHSDAAYSIFFFVNACGFLIAYAYESILCTDVKIYILIFALITGIIGYLMVEYSTSKRIKTNESQKTSEVPNI